MTPSRNLSGNLELNPQSRINVVMEQNPSKKTELMSETRTCVKLSFQMKRVFVVLLVMIGFGFSANTQTIRYVKLTGTGGGSSWADASNNIQAMINASSVGDQVWIASGAYLLSATLEMKNRVSIYGGFFGDETDINQRQKSGINPWEFTNATILDGQNAVRVLNQENAFTSETVCDGVTITKGKGDYDSWTCLGGGAYIRENGKLINCIISNNNVSGWHAVGAGIYNNGGAISHCFINNNTASSTTGNASGGGVYNINGTISFCTITYNTSAHTSNQAFDASGGGISNNNGTINNCTVSNNICSSSSILSVSYGGGIYNSSSSSRVIDCIVENNKTIYNYNGTSYSDMSRGGGIYGGTVSRCFIIGNISGQGGGLHGSIASNCLILLNSGLKGGGAYDGTYTNCTFVENSATNSGGGLYRNSGTVTANNCIFWKNAATSSGSQISTNVTVNYSAVQDGYTGTANITITADNMIGGPMFVNPSADNYSLLAGSPCVDAGNNTYLSYDDMIDIAGNSRIHNNVVDMGAYECLEEVSIVKTEYGKFVRFYPNPTNDKFIVEFNSVATIKLYDMFGKEVLIQTVNGKTEINISHLPKGVYNVQILSESKIVGNSKIVKQ